MRKVFKAMVLASVILLAAPETRAATRNMGLRGGFGLGAWWGNFTQEGNGSKTELDIGWRQKFRVQAVAS